MEGAVLFPALFPFIQLTSSAPKQVSTVLQTLNTDSGVIVLRCRCNNKHETLCRVLFITAAYSGFSSQQKGIQNSRKNSRSIRAPYKKAYNGKVKYFVINRAHLQASVGARDQGHHCPPLMRHTQSDQRVPKRGVMYGISNQLICLSL